MDCYGEPMNNEARPGRLIVLRGISAMNFYNQTLTKLPTVWSLRLTVFQLLQTQASNKLSTGPSRLARMVIQ